MEFEHVGLHCALPSCGQKDFLPFQCNGCHKAFCLEHRSYQAHSCQNPTASKDKTSIDCPVCGKSVIFDKGQDVDQIWTEHFHTVCSQQPAPKKAIERCARSGCVNHLGPSNTFTCTKCRQKVCLSHRIPEDHNCSAVAAQSGSNNANNKLRNNFLDRFEAQAKVNTSTVKAKTAVKTSGSVSSTNTKVDENNTLRGSAQRRMKPASQTTPATPASVPQSQVVTNDDLQCPICGMTKDSPALLQRHVNEVHFNEFHYKTPVTNSQPPPNITTAANGNQEVCPMCGVSFSDPVALISHCEAVHHNNTNSSSQVSASDGNQRECNIV
eukprot:gene1734-1894_t